jgi:ribosome-associated toxin RatA of RatAB toxin-antitoxin module
MRTVDRVSVAAPLERVFAVAADVERWPDFLEHYRWVRMRQGAARGAVVEMAAWRPFGFIKYPTWWLSEMETDSGRHTVRYRHIGGITTGMDVEWKLEQRGDRVDVTIVHEWDGPRWPLISWIAANWVIGPVFIHGIASRTLAGVKRKAESS